VCVCVCLLSMCVYIQLQSATKIRRSRFRRAYTDAASETLTPGSSTAAAGQVLATSAVVPPVSITVRVLLFPHTHTQTNKKIIIASPQQQKTHVRSYSLPSSFVFGRFSSNIWVVRSSPFDCYYGSTLHLLPPPAVVLFDYVGQIDSCVCVCCRLAMLTCRRIRWTRHTHERKRNVFFFFFCFFDRSLSIDWCLSPLLLFPLLFPTLFTQGKTLRRLVEPCARHTLLESFDTNSTVDIHALRTHHSSLYHLVPFAAASFRYVLFSPRMLSSCFFFSHRGPPVTQQTQ